MPPPTPAHPAAIDPQDLLKQCTLTRNRASGPGGQRKNKVETAVQLTHKPTGIIGQASESRQPVVNQRAALHRLRCKLAVQVRTPLTAAQPSPRWQQRVARGRLALNPDHADMPALLAEALDVLHTLDYEMPKAATWLGISTTQLVKLLALEPQALQSVNHQRAQRHQHPLKPRR